jgi:hypothetical protein
MTSRSNLFRVPVPVTAKWYNRTYLPSVYWKWRRLAYLLTVGHRCETFNCTRRATEVHHLSYNNLFGERDTDLVALCRDCHAWRHQVAANDNEDQLEFCFRKPKREDAS